MTGIHKHSLDGKTLAHAEVGRTVVAPAMGGNMVADQFAIAINVVHRWQVRAVVIKTQRKFSLHHIHQHLLRRLG